MRSSSGRWAGTTTLARPPLLLGLMIGFLIACAPRDADSAPIPPCRPAADSAALIASRLTGGATAIRDAHAVPLRRPVGQYAVIVAGAVEGEVGAWGVGPWLGGARILALDTAASRWSDWGAIIADDSPAGRQRSQLRRRPEAEAARSCVRADEAGP